MLRDVLDAVRGVASVVAPESAARSLAESALGLAAADRARCWFYDGEASMLYDGADCAGPQLPADHGVVALAARGRVGLRLDSFGADVACGGPVDAACLRAGDRVLCQPVIAPDGQCHAVLVVARSPSRDTFSRGEETALAALAAHSGAALGQIAMRGRIEELVGDADGPFRREAMDAYDAAGEEGAVVRISPAWVSGVYFALSALVITSMVFLFVGRVHEYGSGVAVIRDSSRVAVVARQAGTVEKIEVAAGQAVREGQILARLYDGQESKLAVDLEQQWETQLRHYLLEPGSESVRQALASLRSQRRGASDHLEDRLVRAPRAGVIGEVHTHAGAPLSPGEVVASISSFEHRFRAFAFVPASYAPQIEVGMPLRLEITGYPYVYVQATVSKVSFEATGAGAVSRQIGPELGDAFAPPAATVTVEADLPTDSFEVDGRRLGFREGMAARADVRLRSESIARALLPWLRKL